MATLDIHRPAQDDVGRTRPHPLRRLLRHRHLARLPARLPERGVLQGDHQPPHVERTRVQRRRLRRPSPARQQLHQHVGRRRRHRPDLRRPRRSGRRHRQVPHARRPPRVKRERLRARPPDAGQLQHALARALCVARLRDQGARRLHGALRQEPRRRQLPPGHRRATSTRWTRSAPRSTASAARASTSRCLLAGFPAYVIDRGRISAYLIGSSIGHGVAESVDDMLALYNGIGATTPGSLSNCCMRQGDLYRAALAAGHRNQKVMNLMAYGPYEDPSGTWVPSVMF